MPNRIEIGKDLVSADTIGLGTITSGVAALVAKGLGQPFYAEEELTISTSGATTDSTQKLLPANSLILCAMAYVTTTLVACTNWALGDSSTADRFVTATTDLTAATTKYSANQWDHSKAAGYTPWQAAAASIRVTTTGSTPTAGKIKIVVIGFQFTAPAS